MKGSALTPALPPALISWIVAVAVVWLAVGPQPLYQAVLIAVLGVLYLLFPPSGPFPRSLLLLSGLFLALAGTAFLPASWLGVPFRGPLQENGIQLPWTYSPQPWLSWDDFTLMAAGLLWAWFCFETRLSREHRQFLAEGFLIALGCVAVATICRHGAGPQDPPAFFQRVGQFVNRNLTGNILVMGGVFSFALGRSRITRNPAAGIFWMIVTFVFLVAIILNGSRAALILFGGGLLLLSALAPKSSRHRAITPVLAVTVLMIGALIFISQGGELQDRFGKAIAGGREGRLGIYEDAASMVKLSPVLGAGLGNFEGIYNTLRVHSADDRARAFHPESDWWWMAADLGLAAVVVFVLMVVLGFRTYLRKTPFPSLTNASMTVAIVFLVHSLFDISGHLIGTAWSCLYLVSLGACRQPGPGDVTIPRIVLRLTGLSLLALACLRYQSVGLNPWMPTRGSITYLEEDFPASLPPAAQEGVLDRAISWAPLNWGLYYRRALVELFHPEVSTQANADFDRVLFLDQNSLQIPDAIGSLCMDRDTPEAIVAWRKLLQRSGQRREEIFQGYINFQEGMTDKKREALIGLAGDDPDLQALAAMDQGPANFEAHLEKLLAENPDLRGVTKPTMTALLNRWIEIGDPQAFIKEWALHPQWHEAGWKAYVRALAQTGHQGEAVSIALSYLPAPKMPDSLMTQDLDTEAREFRANPQDSYRGILLYSAQKSRGMNEDALNTLSAIAKIPQRPAYVPVLLANDLLQVHQDAAAWEALKPVLDGP